MKSLDTKHKLIEMRAKGLSYDAIAKKLGTSKPTLIDWGREMEEEIAQAKAIKLEALYEEFFLLKEARIRTFGGMLKKIHEELEGRKFKDIPTDKLLDLFTKYHAIIKEEFVEPVFISSEDMKSAKEEREVIESY